MKEYVCNICGKVYYDVDSYFNCVNNCCKEVKENAKQKRLEEINAALNKVKQAKAYYEEQLALFKTKYPEEYDYNFGTERTTCVKDNDDVDDWLAEFCGEENPKGITISVENGNNGKPTIKANGKQVSDEFVKDLFSDPEMQYIGKMIGLI